MNEPSDTLMTFRYGPISDKPVNNNAPMIISLHTSHLDLVILIYFFKVQIGALQGVLATISAVFPTFVLFRQILWKLKLCRVNH